MAFKFVTINKNIFSHVAPFALSLSLALWTRFVENWLSDINLFRAEMFIVWINAPRISQRCNVSVDLNACQVGSRSSIAKYSARQI